MEFTWETLIVAIFAILPGFVSDGVRSQLDPSKRSAGEWVGESIVTSLFLNAFALCVFVIPTGGIDLSRDVNAVARQLGATSGWRALQYLGTLYVFALLWGAFSGVFGARYGQKLLGFRLRLTPISGADNTFIDALDHLVHTQENLRLDGKPAQQVPWLRVRRSDMVILGQMQNSSEQFELAEPFEVFFSRAYVFKDGKIVAREPYDRYLRGLHLRVRPEDVIEVLVTRADWDPFFRQPAAAPLPR
jgi:hypothetical protein